MPAQAAGSVAVSVWALALQPLPPLPPVQVPVSVGFWDCSETVPKCAQPGAQGGVSPCTCGVPGPCCRCCDTGERKTASGEAPGAPQETPCTPVTVTASLTSSSRLETP